MQDKIKSLLEKWLAENARLKADYEKLKAAESVIGKEELEKLLILKDRSRLQNCISDLQDLIVQDLILQGNE